MAKKNDQPRPKKRPSYGAVVMGSGVREEPITSTLEGNFMPYAMSVIISRAIPEIDGFKPSHRKLLYTMYKMGLLSGPRTKSANVVGQTMKLNPHGDMAIYETLVRMSKGNESLLHPYVDSKGNFGKAYSRDMAFAAPRYTEVRLDELCKELFADIESDTVDFVDNYDATMKEPTLLPVRFPSILVNANTGIAVGMASSICPFNLAEVCETTIALIKNPGHDIIQTLKAPDFPGGGMIVYDRKAIEEIYQTGRGSIRVRARWKYDKDQNCIEITEIPPTTTVEAIMDKIVELVKAGKVKEISDMRDETDLSGLKLTIDCKRGTDPDKLMARLMKLTPLEDAFSANFNVLIGSTPMVMGVREILDEWTAFRVECVKRRIYTELSRKKERLHLLRGLEAILLDIDRAIATIRQTPEEAEVVPNLMIEFGIDRAQAEYVAEIKLRQLNREYILKRTGEIGGLMDEIAELEKDFSSKERQHKIIIKELQEIARKYGKPRRSLLLEPSDEPEFEEEQVADYPVTLFFTREGYFKKLTPQAQRNAGEQKLKEGDEIIRTIEGMNSWELLVFTDRQQAYKARVSEFEDGKVAAMGEYLPAKLGFDEGENIVYMTAVGSYEGSMLFFFENGKAARVALESYATKQNRRKLLNAYSGASRLVGVYHLGTQPQSFAVFTSDQRCLAFEADLLDIKSTRDTIGVNIINLKKGHVVERTVMVPEGSREYEDYRVFSLPRAGTPLKHEQLGL